MIVRTSLLKNKRFVHLIFPEDSLSPLIYLDVNQKPCHCNSSYIEGGGVIKCKLVENIVQIKKRKGAVKFWKLHFEKAHHFKYLGTKITHSNTQIELVNRIFTGNSYFYNGIKQHTYKLLSWDTKHRIFGAIII